MDVEARLNKLLKELEPSKFDFLMKRLRVEDWLSGMNDMKAPPSMLAKDPTNCPECADQGIIKKGTKQILPLEGMYCTYHARETMLRWSPRRVGDLDG